MRSLLVGSENPVSKEIYEKTNKEVERRANIIRVGIVDMSIPGLLLANAVFSYIKYFRDGLGNESFMLAFPIWLPFDWRDPYKYLLAFVLQSCSHYLLLRVVIVNLNYLMAVCEFFIAFTKDIKYEVNEIGECIRDSERQHEVKRKLCDFIELHGFTKEFVLHAKLHRCE